MTSFSGDIMCEVALPNREIALVYNKEILQRLEHDSSIYGDCDSGSYFLWETITD